MSEHSILSPSSAHRRIRCLGSLAASKGVPNTSSEYAAEGTAYHEIAAKCLIGNYPVSDWVGFKIKADGYEFTITEENAAYAQVYVDAIRRIPGKHFYEVALDTSEVVGVAGQGGTGDAVTLDYEAATIHVDDLKFGMRVVYAKDNEQLLEYGAAALLQYSLLGDWKFLTVSIHQPRANHYDTYTYSVQEVREWVERIRPLEQWAFEMYRSGTPEQIRAAMTPTAKGCEWCPIRGNCPARTEAMMQEFPVMPTEPNVLIQLSDAQVAAAMDRIDDLEGWCRDTRAEAMRRALAGRTLPGWKVVTGRAGNRKWIDDPLGIAEGRLIAILGDEAYQPRKILSPSTADALLNKKRHPQAAERIAAWADLQGSIDREPPSQSLARVEDPRDSINKTPVEFAPTPGA